MLTKYEWQRHAETAAAHKHGEDNAGFYIWRRRLAGPWGVALGAGVFVLMVRAGVFPALFRWLGHLVGGRTGACWIAFGALTLVTAIMFRPTKAVRPAATTLALCAVAFPLWIVFIFYAIHVFA